jgi:hypothetical protein
MYRWHATSTGMIPKTLGAIAVENTGRPQVSTVVAESSGASAQRPTAAEDSPVVLDVRGDAESAQLGAPPTPAAPQDGAHRTNG